MFITFMLTIINEIQITQHVQTAIHSHTHLDRSHDETSTPVTSSSRH